MREINLVGRKFNSLVVREMLPSGKCMVDCDCGTTGHVVNRHSVRRGLSRTCGCGKRGPVKHGESVAGAWTPEYRAWVNMITRCHNPNATRFKNWGGRGISVCPEWKADFSAFLAHVGRRPSAKHSLDRHPNNDGNYEPGNIRWATKLEQRLNSRPKSRKALAASTHAENKATSEQADKDSAVPTFGTKESPAEWPTDFDGPELYWNGDHFLLNPETGSYLKRVAS